MNRTLFFYSALLSFIPYISFLFLLFILLESLNTETNAQIYASGPRPIPGRSRTTLVSGSFESEYLIMMFYRDNAKCLYTLWRKFLLEFYGNMNDGPSYVTIRRFFANRHFTRKIMEMRHTLRNEEEIRRYRSTRNSCYLLEDS